MGSCESNLNQRLVEFRDEDVDLVRAHMTRSWWRRNLRSTLSQALLMDDGKALADFFVFLRQENMMDSLLDAWQLCTSRFALEWTSDAVNTSTRLASSLEEAWEAYLEAPSGYGNFKDVQEWEAARASTGTEESPHNPPCNGDDSSGDSNPKAVSQDHIMYEFAIAAMFGIHVAMVCFSITDSAVALAVGHSHRQFVAVWEETFPDISLLRCLQNSCLRYSVPPEGSAYSPQIEELTKGQLKQTYFIEDFCPELFAQMRHLCGVSNQDYYASICRPDVEFVEFGTNSCSGELFFFSHDGKFLLKTTTVREAETLMRMLPDLVRRYQVAPHSMLGKYVGLYRVFFEDRSKNDLLFFVMGAATLHQLPVHHTYDLKGSTKGRLAKPHESVRKDLDFINDFSTLRLPPEVALQLLDVHAEDLEVLRSHSIMDYSVLLQVHDRKAFEAPVSRLAQGRSCVRLGAKAPTPGSQWAKKVSGIANRTSLEIQLEHDVGARIGCVPTWRPGTGIWSGDGGCLYTMSIIDMLVPFNWWYPKAQVVGQQVLSCGGGDQYSRARPDRYAERQIQMMRRICGVGSDEEEEEESSDEEDEDQELDV